MKMNISKYAQPIQESCKNFIDENLDDIYKHLTTEENKVKLNDFSKNDIDEVLADEKSWGIYAFFITPVEGQNFTYGQLEEHWKKMKEDKKTGEIPKTIKGRFEGKERDSIKSPTCLYLGKSEELGKRIRQHIHSSVKGTYALKISKHTKLHKIFTFKYSYVQIEPNGDFKDGMQCLLLTLEKRLREQLKPLIGKQ